LAAQEDNLQKTKREADASTNCYKVSLMQNKTLFITLIVTLISITLVKTRYKAKLQT
jgi:hypothetical protein